MCVGRAKRGERDQRHFLKGGGEKQLKIAKQDKDGKEHNCKAASEEDSDQEHQLDRWFLLPD